jgi:hypothetical protein
VPMSEAADQLSYSFVKHQLARGLVLSAEAIAARPRAPRCGGLRKSPQLVLDDHEAAERARNRTLIMQLAAPASTQAHRCFEQ